MTADFSHVLVVIPCLDEEATLPGLLDTLIREAPGAAIAVADGGSADASRTIAAAYAQQHANVHLIDNPDRLQSAGINRAAKMLGAGRQWLVRIDAHCHYPPGYVPGLLAARERTGANAVVVPMRSIGVGCFQRAAAAAQNSRLGTGGSPHRHVGTGAFVDHGHHALFELDRFQSLGGYDEGFSHNEDAELDHRQTVSGARIWLEPSLALDYLPRSSLGSLFKQYYRYGRGRAMTIARHGMPIKARQLLPLAVLPAMIMLPVAPWWSLAALPAAAWALLCLVYGAWNGVSTRSLCAAASGIAAMLMHIGWALGFTGERLRQIFR